MPRLQAMCIEIGLGDKVATGGGDGDRPIVEKPDK